MTGLHPQQAFHETSLHFEPVGTDCNLTPPTSVSHEEDEVVHWIFFLGVLLVLRYTKCENTRTYVNEAE